MRPPSREALAAVMEFQQGCAVRLDVAAVSEDYLTSAASASMRRALLVAGTDLGDRMRIEPVEGTARRMMRAASRSYGDRIFWSRC